ncbi:hypothetical protein AMECASPLE_031444, partial [Ameca splendens]
TLPLYLNSLVFIVQHLILLFVMTSLSMFVFLAQQQSRPYSLAQVTHFVSCCAVVGRTKVQRKEAGARRMQEKLLITSERRCLSARVNDCMRSIWSAETPPGLQSCSWKPQETPREMLFSHI